GAVTVFAGEIHHAARDGDLGTVQSLLDSNADLLADCDSDQMTPLHHAAYNGRDEVVAYLLDKGADVNPRNSSQGTPLHGAAYYGHAGAARLLLEHGATVDAQNVSGFTPLLSASAAGHTEIVNMLLERGADTEISTGYAGTPLNAAVFGGHIEVVRRLIEAGADVNTPAPRGNVPLHTAVLTENEEMLDLLMAGGANTEVTDNSGATPLLWAARAGQTACVLSLISRGASVNACDNHGVTPLMISCINGNSEMVRQLASSGADVNAKEQQTSRTPLHLAAVAGDCATARVLLSSGADINAVDNSGALPIHYAARYGHKDVTDLFRQYGATADNLVENFGYAPDLNTTMVDGEAVMWYLGICGWAIRTANHLLIFDYHDTGKNPSSLLLANGHINPDEIAGQDITVFVTHQHRDHFDTTIFHWEKAIDNLTYVFGFRPEEHGVYDDATLTIPAYEFVGPRMNKNIKGIQVATIEANDAGVGFLVKVDGLTMYHAGDHAGWNQGEKEQYTGEIDYLASISGPVDLAFLNVTGCHCQDTVALMEGNSYTLEKLSPKVMIPTHAAGREYIYREITTKAQMQNHGCAFVCPRCRGDKFRFSDGKIL
ncbi:MAG: ankyrin repeat domain-containing protein, partial [Candidatus Zixiibacteriota bacterium]